MPGLGDTTVSRTGLEFLALKELVAFLSFALDSEMCSFAGGSSCSEMPIIEPHLGLFKLKPSFDRELIGT